MKRGQKQSSIRTTFTCWNTMLGSGIVTLPWTFYHSGFILGTLISFISFIVSMRTCILVMRTTGPGEDFYDTMYRYWGQPGYMISIMSILAIMIAACTSYYIIMAQMLYSNVLALGKWIFKADLPVVSDGVDFSHFSLTYVAIGLYFVMLAVCLRRDLSIFIRISSYGAIYIIIITLGIIAVGFYSLSNTTYQYTGFPSQT